MKHLRKITVIGLGLLGGSVGLAVSQSLTGVKTAGFSHRPSTRAKARRLKVVDEVFDDIKASVKDAGLVILATPIGNFEETFRQIADSLPANCIVTDVGSTKLMPHRWADKCLPKNVHYVGSHPIAGSEQRGVEFCRDDLFYKALCILTTTPRLGSTALTTGRSGQALRPCSGQAKNTDKRSLRIVKEFWSALGCFVKIMTPARHDRIFADVSHLPHITAAALVNASNAEELKFAGKGFMDSSRIASGPSNIWADVLMTNAQNTIRGIDRLTAELAKLKKVIRAGDRKKIERLLAAARQKRSNLIKYKMNRKELI